MNHKKEDAGKGNSGNSNTGDLSGQDKVKSKEADEENKVHAHAASAHAERIKEQEAKIADLTATLQRLQADTDNYRKQMEKQNSEMRRYAIAGIIQRLLPVLDSFELALETKQDGDQFRKGVGMIYGQMYDMLEKEGVKRIETNKQRFDPYYHEVLLTEPAESDEEDGEVSQELQKGYLLDGRVLRYAKVKIRKKEDKHGRKENKPEHQ